MHAVLHLQPDRPVAEDDEALEEGLGETSARGLLIHDDGAELLVIADEDTSKASPNPAWIHGTVMRSEATTAAERDQVNPQASRDAAAAIYQQAGITNPIEEIDAAEI